MSTGAMLGLPAPMKEDLLHNAVFPRRMGFPEEFALLVGAIVENDYLNGVNIRLDGAQRLSSRERSQTENAK
jgi:hypothetical protein